MQKEIGFIGKNVAQGNDVGGSVPRGARAGARNFLISSPPSSLIVQGGWFG